MAECRVGGAEVPGPGATSRWSPAMECKRGREWEVNWEGSPCSMSDSKRSEETAGPNAEMRVEGSLRRDQQACFSLKLSRSGQRRVWPCSTKRVITSIKLDALGVQQKASLLRVLVRPLETEEDSK